MSLLTHLNRWLTPNKRLPNALDGLRALAIVCVLISHTPGRARLASAAPLGRSLATATNLGWIGVDLFFVLSGFLIGGQVLSAIANRNFTLRAFYTRRVLRIFPAFYFSVALTCVLYRQYAVFGPTFDPTHARLLGPIIKNLLYLHNYSWSPLQSPFWSLAIEEQFYLVLPLGLLLVARGQERPQFIRWILAGIALSTITRALTYIVLVGRKVDASWLYVQTGLVTHNRFDSLLLGVLCAALVKDYATALRRLGAGQPTAGAVGALLVALSVCFAGTGDATYSMFADVWCYTVASIGWALVLLYLVLSPSTLARGLSAQWLYLVAVISYTIYLHHFPVIYLVSSVLARVNLFTGSNLLAFVARFVAGTLTSGVVALALYVAIERPILRWKEAHTTPVDRPESRTTEAASAGVTALADALSTT